MSRPVLCLCGGLAPEPSLCSRELIPLPFLHRPRHPSASRPHSPEPRHSHPCATSTVSSQPDNSPSPPRRSRFQEQPSPNHWDPCPAWRVHHYVRKAPPAPPQPAAVPCGGVHFSIRVSKDCFKAVSRVSERLGWEGCPQQKGRKVLIQGSN